MKEIDNSNIKRIHINKHIIARNKKHGECEAPITCKTSGGNDKGHTVQLIDPETGLVVAEVLHRPEKPLSCGAVVWIETRLPVRVK